MKAEREEEKWRGETGQEWGCWGASGGEGREARMGGLEGEAHLVQGGGGDGGKRVWLPESRP